MTEWYALYLLPYVGSFLVSFALAVYAAVQYKVRGALPYALVAFFEAMWTLLFILEIITPHLQEKIFLDNVQWVLAFAAGLATLNLGIYFSRIRWRRAYWWLLAVFPAGFSLLVFTNDARHLIYPQATLIPALPAAALTYEYTPVVWAAIVYIMLLTIVALLLMARRLRQCSGIEAARTRLLSIGIALPLIGDMLFMVSGVTFLGHRDVAPILFGFSNALMGWGILRQKLFDVLPTALDHAFASVQDAVIIVDTNQKIISMNAAAQALAGISGADASGKAFGAVFTNWTKIFSDAHEPVPAQTEIICKHPVSDAEMFIDLRLELIHDAGGGLRACLIIARDITRQKNAERVGRQLQQAIEQSSSSIVITDTQGKIEYVNPRFSALTGYSFEEVSGANPSILKTGITPPETYTSLWNALLSGSDWHGEFVNRKKNGEIYWEKASIAPVKDENGVTTHYVAVKDDITASKQLEQELRAAEKHYHALFEQSIDAVLIIGLDGKIREANYRAAELLGYTREELTAMMYLDLAAPSQRRFSKQTFEQLQQDKRIPLYERILQRKDGTEIPGEVSVELIRAEDGAPLYVQAIVRDIAQRKQTEHELLETQNRFELALWGAGIGLWDQNNQTGEVVFNRQWAEMLGYREDEIEPHARTWSRLVHPDDMPQVWEHMQDYLVGKLPFFEAIYRLRTKSGGWKWILDRSKVLTTTEDGSPLRVVGVHLDITEIQEIKRQLEESEARYKTIIAAMAEGIVFHNREGVIITCNTAAERILGLTFDQMVGRSSVDPLWRAVHEDHSPFPGEDHPAMVTLRTGRALSNVIMGVHKPDGSLTWISINSQPVFVQDQQEPYAVVASFADITQRRRAEEALHQSEARFSQAFFNSPVPMVISTTDPERPMYIDVNEAYLQLIGWRWDDLVNKSLVDLDIVVENKDRTERLSELDSFRHYRMKEAQIRHRSGKIRDVMISAQRIEIGSETYDIEIILDITERKQAQEQALALSVERERVRLITHFIESASHEFRTPLSIIGTSTYLLARLTDDKLAVPQVERINTQIKRIIRLLDMLLMMAQLDSGSPLDQQPVSLSLLIYQAKTVADPECVRKHLTLDIEIPQQPVLVAGDAGYLQHMLDLLLENAVRYTPDDGRILVRLYSSSENGCIEITDTGIGIAPENIPHLFERFWRQDESHSQPGFGLGMPIAQKIVELHSGDIHVESVHHQGTTIRIRLPLIPQQSAAPLVYLDQSTSSTE